MSPRSDAESRRLSLDNASFYIAPTRTLVQTSITSWSLMDIWALCDSSSKTSSSSELAIRSAPSTAMAMSKTTFWRGPCWMHKGIKEQWTNNYYKLGRSPGDWGTKRKQLWLLVLQALVSLKKCRQISSRAHIVLEPGRNVVESRGASLHLAKPSQAGAGNPFSKEKEESGRRTKGVPVSASLCLYAEAAFTRKNAGSLQPMLMTHHAAPLGPRSRCSCDGQCSASCQPPM